MSELAILGTLETLKFDLPGFRAAARAETGEARPEGVRWRPFEDLVIAVRLSAGVRSGVVVLLLGPVVPFVPAGFLGVVDIVTIGESDCSRR